MSPKSRQNDENWKRKGKTRRPVQEGQYVSNELQKKATQKTEGRKAKSL